MDRLLKWHPPTGLWKFCPGTKASGHHLCTLPLLPLPESPRKELIPLSGTQILADATSLYHLTLVVSRAYFHRSHRIVINSDRILKQLPPLRHSKTQ